MTPALTHGSRYQVLLAILLTAALLLAACGGDDGGGDPATPAATGTSATTTLPVSNDDASTAATGQPSATAPGAATTATGEGGEQPAVTSTPLLEGDVRLTAEQLAQYRPNELGQIPVLEYHHFGETPEQFVRTPDQFRADLQWLYEHGFYVISLHDFLANRIQAPAGKRPVILTFDDSPASQFRLIPLANGQLAVDPNCAIGIMETFFAAHPDFGRGGHFAVLPNDLFDWTPTVAEEEQTAWAPMKLQWLLEHGYEIGNHTIDHANLSTLDADQVKYQLAEANLGIRAVAPSADVQVITLPYGMFPIGPSGGGDDTLFRGFDYKGEHFVWTSALLVGANPTVVPYSNQYDPYAVARIQAFDDELNKWFGVFESDPGILYVSDGNPNLVTIPNDLHPWLVGTLDESKIGDRELIRY